MKSRKIMVEARFLHNVCPVDRNYRRKSEGSELSRKSEGSEQSAQPEGRVTPDLTGYSVEAGEEDVYRPLGAPSRLYGEGLTPLVSVGDGRVIVSSSDGVASFDASKGELTAISSRQAYCGASVAEGRVTVLTEKGPVVAEALPTGRYGTVREPSHQWPGVSIVAERMAPVEMQIDAVSLSGVYTAGDILTVPDRNKVLQAVNRAYESLYGEAVEEGVFFQPVIARAVVRDVHGTTIWHGPEVLVSHPDGIPLETPLKLGMDSQSTTRLTTVSIPTYRLRVKCGTMTSQSAIEAADSLSVEIVSSFHTWSKDASHSVSPVTVTRGSVSGTELLVSQPGRERGFSRADILRNHALTRGALMYFDMLSVNVPVCSRPYKNGVDEVIGCHGFPSLGKMYEKMNVALTDGHARTGKTDLWRLRLNAPHSFTARQVSSTGAVVAYGDMEALLYAGYTPTDYACAFRRAEGVEWQALTTVMFRDGTSVRRVSRGKDEIPQTLSPLTVYPDPAAVSVRIIMKCSDESKSRGWQAALTPDSSRRLAYGLSESLSERDLADYVGTEPDFDTEADSNVHLPLGDLVGVAGTETPLRIQGLNRIGRRVTAIVGATSTAASWDYGRTRFYVFTDETLTLVNASADLETIACVNLANVGVDRPGRITGTDFQSIYFVGKTGTLYNVTGTRVTAMAKLPDDTDCLGYDAGDGRLMAGATTGAGVISHINPTTGRTEMTSTGYGPFDGFFNSGNFILAPSQDGMYDVAMSHRGTPADGTEVRIEYSYQTKEPHKSVKVRCVFWNMDSSHFEGHLVLQRTTFSRRPVDTVRYNVKGRVATKIAMPVVSRPFAQATLTIEGKVSSDTLIAHPYLKTN